MIYNAIVIAIARALMNLATWLFIVGMFGSLLVVLISFFEDLGVILGKE